MSRCRVVLLLAVVTAAGCARTSGPVEVPPEDLPAALRGSPTPTPTPVPAQALTVYLVRQARLVPATRTSDVGAQPDAALRALVAGPSDEERAAGITTAVPAATGLLDLAVHDGVAVVDLSQEFEAPASEARVRLRLAQVVWTLTSFPDVSAVRFLVEGEPVDAVTDADGTVERPVTRADYRSFAPEASE